MTTILHIDASARYEGSVTRPLSAKAVEKLRAADPGATVVYRDLTGAPLPHIEPNFLAGIFGVSQEREAGEALRRSDALVDELLAADVLVIGAPMYNFGVSSQLKAWIDHVARNGRTFRYTPEGPVGLVTGKRAIVVTATGGIYSDGPMAAYDHVVPYLKQVLGFIGITDVTSIVADRQGLGPEAAADGVAAAHALLEAA
ncbi:MAG TPA: FMN-dependent NADH-azoreductase [Stellaceae bacterium]|nr:FMN-dependent NADH-azoreductase [Stellaceae bacterium]